MEIAGRDAWSLHFGSMPTVLIEEGYRFFFFSNERGEPPRVHVDKADGYAKVWLQSPRLAWSEGFSSAELRRIREIVVGHEALFLERWNEHFSA